MSSLLRSLPLTAAPVGWCLGVAFAVLLARLLRRRCDVARLCIAVGGAMVAVVSARALLPASIDVARIPTSFLVWTATVLSVAGYVASLWVRAGARWRLGGLLAVALALALTAQQVNTWFAYYPTAGDLVGLPMADQARLDQLRGGDRAARYPRGALVPVDLQASRSGFVHREAMVWLPPSVLAGTVPLREAGDGGRRPVVLLLAGTPGAPDDMVRAGDLDRVAAAYAARHGGDAPILVMADHNGSFAGDTECVGHRGVAEEYLTADVPAGLAQLFGTRTEGWGVIGYSEGGTCALLLALRHPALFPAFVDIAGDLRPNLGEGPARARVALEQLYGGDPVAAQEHDPLVLLQTRRYEGTSGWFVAGRQDRPAVRVQQALAPAAQRAGMVVEVTTPPGHHSFALVNGAAPDCFAWLLEQLAHRTLAEGAPGAHRA